ncbi:MAG TPA: hypothetical protein DEQ87_11040 [Algoriphagus sp.]|jgi:hypothetical protein|uniref:hypothetical protein n=1 Tax=unclassified Algoriphagus TaxID=2641541 RepID=UPI000C4C92D4|nr:MULTISPECIES: hypothetical protein [unclassified Algoriphagus]MAL14838.1 hypothetical protein [Algoriphagus sp.]MAN87900.1 hypothetical protein [Algoriphagus sp.]QYH40413.1 hypothetical protein GYM62_17010 [Algoriphagus sp. NBT04N3]HAD49876.1 hypothetical protein [Algoriphagus sp.]HAH37934.1 hypothetical protein [Algoriphagus sp.]|tara:strand:+ start:1212 stop:1520 length:309 start_codon:yes stop_codon:yes gene_type:complete
MKKALLILMMLGFIGINAAQANPGEKTKKEKTELSAEDSEKIEQLQNRFNEIKAMDFSTLSKDEAKALKIELQEIKAEGRNNGLWLSTGAIILILIIIILVD